MKRYLKQNSKIKAMSGVKTFNFGIPAYKEASGRFTCPMADQCIKGCYASQGFYRMGNVARAYQERYELTRDSENFIDTICNEIERFKIERVRIHDSGDFYSRKYMSDWFRIMRRNPSVQFYAYTKMVKMFKENQKCIPDNFTLIFSEGGKQDNLIRRTDRHSRVFESKAALKRAGYADASKNDSVASGKNKKIGLIYHGHGSKKWSTEK